MTPSPLRFPRPPRRRRRLVAASLVRGVVLLGLLLVGAGVAVSSWGATLRFDAPSGHAAHRAMVENVAAASAASADEWSIIIAGALIAAVLISGTIMSLVLGRRRHDLRLVRAIRGEAESRRLIAALPDAVVMFDRSLRLNLANAEAEKLFGYRPGEMAGMELGLLMVPQERRSYEEKLRAAFATWGKLGETREMERAVRRKDGSEFPAEISVRPYAGAEGEMFVAVLRDISARHARIRALQHSRENLARAQRVAGMGNFERDLVTGAVEWSEEFLRIWGIEDAAPQGTAERLLSLVHPDDREKFIGGRDAALRNEPLPPLDFRIIRPDGEERILHREYGVIFDESGLPIRMFGTIQDVTERKRIENELRRSRETLSRAQRLAAVGSFERDLDTGKIEWFDELYRIHGIEPGGPQANLDTLRSLVHPDDVQKVEAFRLQAANNAPPPIDYRIIRPDGAERVLHRECHLVCDKDGKPILMYGVMQDVTELRHAEMELRRSRENLARAQRVSALGSFERDLVTGEGHWSDELMRIWGVSGGRPESAETLQDLVHPADRQKFIENREAALRHNPSPIDFRIIRPDGAERTLHREYQVEFDEKGTPVHSFGIIQDVTERRAIEDELRRSRENLARAQRIAALGSYERNFVTGEARWSDEVGPIWGLPPGHRPGPAEKLLTLVHPADREKFVASRESAFERNPEPIDFRIIRPDGKERVLHREYEVLRDDSGKPIHSFGIIQDVTERKAIENELRRSREMLVRAQRIAAIGSFEYDIATGKTEWSDELYRLYGLVPGKTTADIEEVVAVVHPDDRKIFLSIRGQVARGARSGADDFRVIHPDGSERILHREYDLLTDDSGKAVCVFGTLQDVTPQKKTEAELMHSRENLARAQRIAHVGSYERDLVTGDIEWSDELFRIHGLDPRPGPVDIERLRGYIHPDDRPKIQEVMALAERGLPAPPLDYRITRADGIERILHREGDVVFDDHGVPVRLIATMQDVTEQKRAELELRRSREALARAQQIAVVGSFEHDLATGRVEWSDQLLRIWGLAERPDVLDVRVLDTLVHPEDRQRFAARREAVLNGETTPRGLDFRIVCPNGEEKFVHNEYAVDFDDHGKAIRLHGTAQDITERKRAEIELRRSRERLTRAQRIAGIGSFDHDLVTDEVEWSDELYRVYGLPRELGGSIETVIPWVHAEDREKFFSVKSQIARRIPSEAVEFRIRRPDGAERVLHREADITFDASGKALRVFGAVQDITERKSAEIELRRSRENMARAQQIAAMGSFESDLATGHTEWSDELYRILGIGKGEANPGYEALISLVHPDDRDQFWLYRMEEITGARTRPFEFRIVRPDGTERILRRESAVVFDEDRRPLRSYGTVQDITFRKQAEVELLRSRENMARAQKIAGMGSFDRDLTKDTSEWSDEMYAVLGLEKSDIVPRYEALLELTHPEDRAALAAHRDAELAGLPSVPIEYRIIRPDGAERIVRRESAVVFDADKRPVRNYGTLQDVTERRLAERRERELERQLLHSQKLEALGTLAGGIAHDLNNTLVPVMALSKLMARRFEPGDIVRANLDTIFEASERARDLVKRVLSFSRKDDTDKRAANLGEIVDEALKLLRATVPSTIQLDVRIGVAAPIFADASQIHQIITNLVSNASQAIGGGIGTITVTVDQPAGGGEVRLAVGDTGMGMDEATQQRIFEPFFTTKPVGQGTGLGLSIVHGIIAGHGGRIAVESAPGRGTRFEIYFPVASARAEMAPAGGLTSSRPAA